MLQAENLSLEPVLKNISFLVKRGEIWGLVGGKGTGKTTLLKLIGGMLKPSRGRVLLRGKVGFLFEEPGCYLRLTVAESLHFFAEINNVPAAAVSRLANELNLHSLLKQKCALLSPGERRRLELAQVLVAGPEVFLGDEPFGNIDSQSIFILQEALKNLADRGAALLLATFGQKEVVEICDHLLYLEGGEQLIESLDQRDREESSSSGNANWQRISVRLGERTLLLEPGDIFFIQSRSGPVEIATRKGCYTANYTLAHLEEKLRDQGFFRSHRSYLVNLKAIKEILAWSKNSYELVLNDPSQTSVPLSKHRLASLEALLDL